MIYLISCDIRRNTYLFSAPDSWTSSNFLGEISDRNFFFFCCTMWHAGSYFHDQGSDPWPLQWKCRVLITEPTGKSQDHFCYHIWSILWFLTHKLLRPLDSLESWMLFCLFVCWWCDSWKMRAHWQGLESWNFQGFPGGSMVKKPSSNAGDRGSTHDLERSHMLQSK